ncbi:two-component system, chemotaxis family, sensor kinase CheA [Allopseudospirillum japonicum]|uniref:Chemotaxis protein CheA n=1 Tax=Allopseudospirillum japonicum TaxID=64971 RepID=A0A1H6SGK4_9GAMM|nr:chemotaxis protein CheA [Allopseudospirillum japonicum]SEI63957.1 two-component system, chemotaxis family, sensor kinase CheA [Allopseudospirillum japonicum]
MNPLLISFINESRDNLEVASRSLLALEQNPQDSTELDDLFRAMHTIKGSSGLFDDFSALTKMLHLAEEALDKLRDGLFQLTSEQTDLLLSAMDVLATWLDEVEQQEHPSVEMVKNAQNLSQKLKQGFQQTHTSAENTPASQAGNKALDSAPTQTNSIAAQAITWGAGQTSWLAQVPNKVRQQAATSLLAQQAIYALRFRPDPQCFFQGQDPFHMVRHVQGLLWYGVCPQTPWPDLVDLDPYQCVLDFYLLVQAPHQAIEDHFRYVITDIQWLELDATTLIFPTGEPLETPIYQSFVEELPQLVQANDWQGLKERTQVLSELGSGLLQAHAALDWLDWALAHASVWPIADYRRLLVYLTGFLLTEEDDYLQPALDNLLQTEAPTSASPSCIQDHHLLVLEILQAQQHMLSLPKTPETLTGAIQASACVLESLFAKDPAQSQHLQAAKQAALVQQTTEPLLTWLAPLLDTWAPVPPNCDQQVDVNENTLPAKAQQVAEVHKALDAHIREAPTHKSIRVDQKRIDDLMTLAGELIVAKNALPYLTQHAQQGMSAAELAKEIKTHYANIDRIADSIQSTVMAARMIPVSTVFQRFPRLVRDLSRKLDKQIELHLEGEETEADKNVIDALADPLIHLIRNSLDHGIENTSERQAAGKHPVGQIILRALPMDDQVLIEVIDDGRGIDSETLKLKAYQKGLIDEAQLDSMKEQEALQLIFAAGLSTAQAVSDISGRGVGMDVVRTSILSAGGQVQVASQVGQGTQIRILLPLSMAVARVMVVEIHQQIYGIPMSVIRETVRVPREKIRYIKQEEVVVLREQVIPLKRMRDLLGLPAADTQKLAEEAVLVVEIGQQALGLVIDDFHQGIDIVQKPLEGVMAGYTYYSGTALMGDGRVLLILNLAALLDHRL